MKPETLRDVYGRGPRGGSSSQNRSYSLFLGLPVPGSPDSRHETPSPYLTLLTLKRTGCVNDPPSEIFSFSEKKVTSSKMRENLRKGFSWSRDRWSKSVGKILRRGEEGHHSPSYGRRKVGDGGLPRR